MYNGEGDYKDKKDRLTSSSFLQIRFKALKTRCVFPEMVTIRSDIDPSEIIISALD